MIKAQLDKVLAPHVVSMNRSEHEVLQYDIFSFEWSLLVKMFLDNLLILQQTFINHDLQGSLVHCSSRTSLEHILIKEVSDGLDLIDSLLVLDFSEKLDLDSPEVFLALCVVDDAFDDDGFSLVEVVFVKDDSDA